MSKVLIIAEKPSVSTDIAKALGKFKKVGEYYENDEYVCCSAVGHLLELCLPSEFEKKKKWSFDALPIVPDAFDLKPIEKSKTRLTLLKKLIKRDDIGGLINACDAGREGELIFRYIVQHCKTNKPVRRLWLQSMTHDAIREGFAQLRKGEELDPLGQAAVCRSESDWLIGINGTRALTALNSKGGGFVLTTVGRVQTPTLAIVVEREQKIRSFHPKTYWEVYGTFGVSAGEYIGRWFDEGFRKPEKSDKDEDSDKKAERIWDEVRAREIQTKCHGHPGIVTEEKRPSSQLSPLLYDLTSLQREGNSRFGLSAKRTLQIAQTLYERHKVLTYPRTDSRCLPEDYVATAKSVLKSMQNSPLGSFAANILNNAWVRPNKRIFDNSRVSDHFAITPTQNSPAGLDEFEYKIYEMVAKRFLAVFYPAAQFEVLTRITRVSGEAFKTDGKVLKEPGWLAIYGREEQGSDDVVVPVKEGEEAKTEKVEVKGLETKPPQHFTEATLLSAMEGAGKLVEDEQLREAMGKKGLGTPATRAAIIEGLLAEKYLNRDGRDLLCTPKAFALMELLGAARIPALTSPEMTGEWEHKLKQMEQKQITRSAFMKEIADLTRQIVENARGFEEDESHSKPFAGRTPTGGPMIETVRFYQSQDAQFKLSKYIAGRLIEPSEAITLLEKKFLGPLDGFRSRMGRPFTAALKLNGEGKVEFVFDESGLGGGETIDFSQQEPVGICPVDGAKVYEGSMAFVCEHSVKKPPTCTFRIGKKILAQDISREQAVKILTAGKSDLFLNFVSQRTKRRFKAFLVLQEGKVKFEFPPREEKPKGAKGKKAAVATKTEG